MYFVGHITIVNARQKSKIIEKYLRFCFDISIFRSTFASEIQNKRTIC